MFLNLLQESNKELFLKVCVHAALANEIFAEEEKDMIYAYCHEMNIAEYIPENVEKLDEVVHSLNAQADEVEKKIIVLEVLGLIKADGVYDEKEKDFMKMLVKKMNVKEDVLSQYNSLLEIYLAVCKELRAAVCE